MTTLVIIVCLLSILITSYTTGNHQANVLMVKLGGSLEEISKWTRYPIIVNYIFFGLFPLILAIYQLGLIGVLYVPIAIVAISKLTSKFLTSQLKARLASKEKAFTYIQHNSDRATVSSMMHPINELKWLIAHPKSAQHLAISDSEQINPKIHEAFKFQVDALDNISKKELEHYSE